MEDKEAPKKTKDVEEKGDQVIHLEMFYKQLSGIGVHVYVILDSKKAVFKILLSC
jgi:hypothetical protein